MKEEQNPWIVKKNEAVYESPWIRVERNEVINPAGNEGIYSVVHFKNLAIGIIPLDEDFNIWLVGQFRFPIGSYSWEIPEGGGKLDTSPIESARRELLEETGIRAVDFKELMRLHLSNSATDELAIVFLARKLSFENPTPEETEILQVKKVHLKEAYELCNQGLITDAISVASILKLYLLYKDGKI